MLVLDLVFVRRLEKCLATVRQKESYVSGKFCRKNKGALEAGCRGKVMLFHLGWSGDISVVTFQQGRMCGIHTGLSGKVFQAGGTSREQMRSSRRPSGTEQVGHGDVSRGGHQL